MGIINDIALSIAGYYYIIPPCYAIPHNCYIAGCYTAIPRYEKGLNGAIRAELLDRQCVRGAIPNLKLKVDDGIAPEQVSETDSIAPLNRCYTDNVNGQGR